MVKALTESKYMCETCHKVYTSILQAKECQNGHQIIYVALERGELKRLVYFLYTGERELLTSSLLAKLEKFATISAEPAPRQNYIPNFDDGEEVK